MCGILGHVSRNGIPKMDFEKVLHILDLRGPDAEDISESKTQSATVLLGHTRLAILDLSDAGKQPMRDRSGKYEIIFNGEIYNYQNIKKKLLTKGYSFKSTSDTEVLLYGYIEYGDDIVKLIEGMFAFAIFDISRSIIFCARDHFGKKPFYYYLDDKQFIFASELKAITAFKGFKPVISELSINKFLFYGYIPSPHTIFKNVFKLPPASSQQFDIAKWKLSQQKCYWDLSRIHIDAKIQESEALETIDSLLKLSVNKRLIADVPLGIFLSGGVDSSLIAAYMRELSGDVTSFTVGYNNYKNDESRYAIKVAAHLGIKTNLKIFNDEEVSSHFKEILNYMDEPLADPAILPLYFIAKAAKNNITVVLSGDGGDEVFGGYPKYQAQLYAERMKLLAPFIKLVGSISNNSILNKFSEGLPLPFHIRQFIYGSGSFLPSEVSQLIGKQIQLDEIFEDSLLYDRRFNEQDLINRSLYLDTRIQLPDWYLVKGDRATMAASLEMRNPFLDKELVEYAFKLKGTFKINGLETKYLLKKLAAKYIPHDVIYRQKRGFAVPLDHWLTNILNIQKFNPKSAYFKNCFNSKYINFLKTTVCERNDLKYKLYRLYILDKFLTTYEQS